MDQYEVKLTFIEPILGTVPKDPDVYRDHVADELTDERLAEELATVEADEENGAKGWTGFHQNGNGPILYDYVIKGFFKDACGMLRRVKGTRSAKLTAYKKVIDGLVFIGPRQIQIDLPDDAEMGVLKRPLRAQTAQGERVALAHSDVCPPGTTIEFGVHVLGVVTQRLLEEWFDYGALRGLGQWRNAGYGRFTYELAKA